MPIQRKTANPKTAIMEDLTILIAVIALSVWPIVCFFYFRRKHQALLERLAEKDLDDIPTQDLVVTVLQAIGCQPVLNEEKHICFKYQGEDFYIATQEDSRFIVIWNPWWGTSEVNNNALPYLKEIVNLVNVDSIVTTVYTTDEEQKHIGFHSKCHIMFTPKEAPLDEYLKVVLDQFFATHDVIKDNFKQLSMASSDTEKEKRVRVKGFASYKEGGTPVTLDNVDA